MNSTSTPKKSATLSITGLLLSAVVVLSVNTASAGRKDDCEQLGKQIRYHLYLLDAAQEMNDQRAQAELIRILRKLKAQFNNGCVQSA